MSSTTIVPRRPARKADVDRIIKAVKGAGYNVASVKVSADGSFEVLTGDTPRPQVDGLDEWRARRDAEMARVR